MNDKDQSDNTALEWKRICVGFVQTFTTKPGFQAAIDMSFSLATRPSNFSALSQCDQLIQPLRVLHTLGQETLWVTWESCENCCHMNGVANCSAAEDAGVETLGKHCK